MHASESRNANCTTHARQKGNRAPAGAGRKSISGECVRHLARIIGNRVGGDPVEVSSVCDMRNHEPGHE